MLSTEEINGWIQYACDCCDMSHLARDIKWEYNNRLTRVLGRAWTHGRKIEISGYYNTLPEYTVDEFIDTIVHEACHIIADVKHKKDCGHGPLWKQCMIDCGLEPLRCYNGKARKKPRKKRPVEYVYVVCTNCGTVTQMKKTEWYRYKSYQPLCEDYVSDYCSGELISLDGRKFKAEREWYADWIEAAKEVVKDKPRLGYGRELRIPREYYVDNFEEGSVYL